MRAAIDRAAVLQALGKEIVEVSFFSLLSMLELIIYQATYLAFNLEGAEDRLLLVPCVLTLSPLQVGVHIS